MSSFSEYREGSNIWATLNYDADADDEAEKSYRLHNRELETLLFRQAACKRKLRAGGRKKRRPQYHDEAHKRIIRDYFGYKAVINDAGVTIKKKETARFTERKFHRRFRMSSNQFQTIHDDITDPEIGCRFFQFAPDASGRKGASNMQKIVAAIRQLAYGTCSDHVHEYTGVAEKTASRALLKFCRWVIRTYGDEFMNTWGEAEIRKEMEVNAKRGFPGMMGSIDCTHWQWKNCPIAWQGMYQDRNHKRSIVAEAICGHDMYFYQVYVGLPGSLNDIAIMGQTTMQSNYMESGAIDMTYSVAGEEFTGAYFLADGIYPDFPYLVKSVAEPVTQQEKLFATVQEGCRKDVERAFGRMLAKWHVLAGAARSWSLKHVTDIWLTCFILHNMTIRDDEKAKLAKAAKDAARAAKAAALRVPIVPEPIEVPHPPPTPLDPDLDQTDDDNDYLEGLSRGFAALRVGEHKGRNFDGVMDAIAQMENKGTCILLKKKLIEHVWISKGQDIA